MFPKLITYASCYDVAEHTIDIFAVSESWLHDDIKDSEIHISGYTLFHKDRVGKDNHGGVACYISDTICSNELAEINSDLECCWIKVSLKQSRPIILGIVYLPKRKVEYLDQLRNEIDKIDAGSSEILIVGDFNFDILDVAGRAKIDEFCCEFQLTQLVSTPTRVTPTTSTCIDLIFSSHPECINVVDVLPLGLSDHSMVIINRNINLHSKAPPRVSKIRNFKTFMKNGVSPT